MLDQGFNGKSLNMDSIESCKTVMAGVWALLYLRGGKQKRTQSSNICLSETQLRDVLLMSLLLLNTYYHLRSITFFLCLKYSKTSSYTVKLKVWYTSNCKMWPDLLTQEWRALWIIENLQFWANVSGAKKVPVQGNLGLSITILEGRGFFCALGTFFSFVFLEIHIKAGTGKVT